MDHIYAFAIFALLVILDLVSMQNWLRPYFRLGIPVYIKRTTFQAGSFSETTAQALKQQFEQQPQHPSIRFKVISPVWLAWSETMFENRGGFKYMPVMHSSAFLNPQTNTLTVTGLVNWYIVFIILYLGASIPSDFTYGMIAVILLIIFALAYSVQKNINRDVVAALQPEPAVEP